MHLRPTSRIAMLLAVTVLLSSGPRAHSGPKAYGLEFPIGQPADRPAARVTISELGQGAQKRGFFRIALLPMACAKGVQIRFLHPEPGVLLEIPETLKNLSTQTALEFQNVSFLAADDPTPRLTAGEITPQKERWLLKRVKWTHASGSGETPECQLILSGPECGKFVRPDHGRAIPPLQELLQAGATGP